MSSNNNTILFLFLSLRGFIIFILIYMFNSDFDGIWEIEIEILLVTCFTVERFTICIFENCCIEIVVLMAPVLYLSC